MPQPLSLRATSRTWSGAHLVAETARAAVDHHRDRAELEAERPRRVLVVDALDLLHLEEVVARSQRAELIAAARLRALADRAGIGAVEHAAFLAVVEIAAGAEAAR